ncbi:hypothetical protein E4U40_002563 [Claviceps sp. LM458 group G5]|nr:hypothetical protein E4U40_002563 [Claviceps sp. LM458 group G5]
MRQHEALVDLTSFLKGLALGSSGECSSGAWIATLGIKVDAQNRRLSGMATLSC